MRSIRATVSSPRTPTSPTRSPPPDWSSWGRAGPPVRLLGDKVAAREVAAGAGVPTVPGSAGRVTDLREAAAIVSRIGLPVMIKAAAGGGGRGIRIVQTFEEFERHFPQASAEAESAFGDGGALHREGHHERSTRRSADPRRRRRCGPLLRTRVLAPTSSAKSVGGRASLRPSLRSSRATVRERRGTRSIGGLQRRRHGRISLRRFQSELLLHRGQHPHTGGTPCDGNDHGHRPRPGNVAGRRRGAALQAPGRHRSDRSRHRMPHQRRGSSEGLRALPGSGRNARGAYGQRHPLRHDAVRGIRRPSLLRLSAGQTRRARPRQVGVPRQASGGPGRPQDRRHPDHDPPPRRSGGGRRRRRRAIPHTLPPKGWLETKFKASTAHPEAVQ